MSPQRSDPLMDSAVVQSSSECGRYDALLLSSTSTSTIQNEVEEEPCRAAEEWLFRGGEKHAGCLSHNVPSSSSSSSSPQHAKTHCSTQRQPEGGSTDHKSKNSHTGVQVWSSNPMTLRDRLSLQCQLRKEQGEPLDAHDAWMVLTKTLEEKEDHDLPVRRSTTAPCSPISPTRKSHLVYAKSKSFMDGCSDGKKDPANERRGRAVRKRDQCDNFMDSDPRYTKPVPPTTTRTTTTTTTTAKMDRVVSQTNGTPKSAVRRPVPQPKENSIKLHIYDLLPTETIMQFAWGCEFPIGQCCNAMNDGLYELGTGVYHVGIEVNGIEYAYGANHTKGTTGVFSCIPKHCPGFEYRTTLDFGSRPLVKTTAWVKTRNSYREVVTYVHGREVIRKMAKEYMGVDYDLWRKNCCTFARDACLRLGVTPEEIPTWFRNLATAGAATQDVAYMTFQPITSMLSYVENDNDDSYDESVVQESQTGFEVTFHNEGRHDAAVHVVDAEETTAAGVGGKEKVNVRRTLSLT